MSLPFVYGFYPATAPNGQLLEARTVQMRQGDLSAFCGVWGGAKGGWPHPCFNPEATSSFTYGSVLFVFGLGNSSPGASPTEAWVDEYWGGNYSLSIQGSGWWVSPDGLSGLQSTSGQNVTLMVAMSGLSYGLPTDLGVLAFAGNGAILGAAVFVLFVSPVRRRRRPSSRPPLGGPAD